MRRIACKAENGAGGGDAIAMPLSLPQFGHSAWIALDAQCSVRKCLVSGHDLSRAETEGPDRRHRLHFRPATSFTRFGLVKGCSKLGFTGGSRMPWNARTALEQRRAFIEEWQREQDGLAELCRKYGISRPTGYKWVQRFEAQGVAGLEELSRAPHNSPQAISGELADQVIALRQQHPRWGPRKLRVYLEKHHPSSRWPANSSIGELLQREGLVQGAPPAAADPALQRTVGPRGRAQPGVVRGLQGVVSLRQRRALRPLDDQRRVQPVFVALPSRGKGRRGTRAGNLRGGISGMWIAGGDPHGQRAAVCGASARRAESAGHVVAAPGDPTRAH